jgi:hypothetical protein
MFQVTFCGQDTDVTISLDSIDSVRAIVESGASIMVEWGEDEWGDACFGKVYTEELHKILYP